MTVLVNAATAAEAVAGLRAGAEGIGLLRTELAFLEAAAWPGDAAHRAALAPVLEPLAGRTATVRVFDFGADKTPPFLRGTPARGWRCCSSIPASWRPRCARSPRPGPAPACASCSRSSRRPPRSRRSGGCCPTASRSAR